MDAGQSDVAPHAKHGTMSVAAGEEDGLLAVNDHWEVEHRAHEAGAEMPVKEGDEHSGENSTVTSTHKWTTSHLEPVEHVSSAAHLGPWRILGSDQAGKIRNKTVNNKTKRTSARKYKTRADAACAGIMGSSLT